MAHKYDDGVLVDCRECFLLVERAVETKKPFPIVAFRNSYNESREEVLGFIVGTLYAKNDPHEEWPARTRIAVTEMLTDHGQFTTDEIDSAFEKWSFSTSSYSIEFLEEHPEVDGLLGKRAPRPWTEVKVKEKRYRFPLVTCDYRKWIGFCPVDIEQVYCPDCGMFTTNTPSNVTSGLTKDLYCVHCPDAGSDPFNVEGLLRSSGPRHHGMWNSQQPEFAFSGTDYFTVFHPVCSKSPLPDRKGEMRVEGVYVDDIGRVVLSLKCIYCGAKNALKPSTAEQHIPLLNESGSTWKSIDSPVRELIEIGESYHLEFKSSLCYDYATGLRNRNLEYAVVRDIVSFMNSDGGVLLIGVSDFGIPLGLDSDYAMIAKDKKNVRDDFGMRLNEVLNQYGVKGHRDLIVDSFEFVGAREICYVDVRPSDVPIHLTKKGKSVLPYRAGRCTEDLSGEEKYGYVKRRWPRTDLTGARSRR